eukprot:TRINITY_DN865_c0_g1_i6.p1 TRINITY_DN865_c0_g1~~TRINITY_DN865_c0_g1_i6.p1  ORF type:complete len:350 (+),score=144.92 TRINITY_DN865_c0_g1_i6:62-1051(+)
MRSVTQGAVRSTLRSLTATATVRRHATENLFPHQQRADYTADNWGKNSEAYDRTIGTKLTQYALDIVPMLDAEYGVAVGGDVLDIGCGAGALMEAVAQHRVPHTSFTAVDFAEDMVAATEAKHAALWMRRVRNIYNPSFRVMDGQALQFADASFDTAFAMFSTLYFPDKMQGLREMCRVVRPGGLGAVAGWTRDVQWIGYSNKAVVKVLGSRMPYSKPEDDDVPNFLAFADEAAFEAMLREAGWGTVTLRRQKRFLTYDSAEEVMQEWHDLAECSPAQVCLLSKFPAEEQGALRDALAKEYAAVAHRESRTPDHFASIAQVATVALLKK